MRSSPEVGRETNASRPPALEDDGRRSGVGLAGHCPWGSCKHTTSSIVNGHSRARGGDAINAPGPHQARPREYAERVTRFLDRALLGSS